MARAYQMREELGGEAPDEFFQDRVIDVANKFRERIGGSEGDIKAQEFWTIATGMEPGRLSLRKAFQAQCKDAERRRSTDEKYEHALSLLLQFLERKDTYPEDVSPDTALQFVDWLNHTAESERGGPLAFQTKKNAVAGLSSLWTYLEHRRQVPRGANPWRNHQITGKPKPHDAPKADAKTSLGRRRDHQARPGTGDAGLSADCV